MCGFVGEIDDPSYLRSIFDCIKLSAVLDFSDALLKEPGSLHRFVELGLFSKDPTVDQVKKLVSRFLFQLKPSLVESVEPMLSQFEGRSVIGLQLRTGGKLANYKEDTTFITLNDMERVCGVIDDCMSRRGFHDPHLFLSTDSNQVVELFRNGTYPLLVSDQFTIGHSSRARKGSSESIYRAVTDMLLLSKCDALITTKGSSFGDQASLLSDAAVKILL